MSLILQRAIRQSGMSNPSVLIAPMGSGNDIRYIDMFTDDIFDDLIDRGYDYYCEEVEPDSAECDEYWEDYD